MVNTRMTWCSLQTLKNPAEDPVIAPHESHIAISHRVSPSGNKVMSQEGTL
jgi:hypothetical protein